MKFLPGPRSDLPLDADTDPVDVCARIRAEVETRPGAVIVHVYGQADAHTEARWGRLLDAALLAAASTGHLVIDTGETGFLGCRPIFALVARAQHAAARGLRVSVLTPVPDVVARVVTITGLAEWLSLYTELDEALDQRVGVTP